MVAGICACTFTAMAAAVIVPDPSIALSGTAVPAEILAWRWPSRASRSCCSPSRACGCTCATSAARSSRATACGASPTPRSRSGGLRRRPHRHGQRQLRRPRRPSAETLGGVVLSDLLDEAVVAGPGRCRRGRAGGPAAPVRRQRRSVEVIRASSISPAGRMRRWRCATSGRASAPRRASPTSRNHDALTGAPNRTSFNDRWPRRSPWRRPPTGRSRCCAPISTASRRSTTCSGTPPATPCCAASARRSPARSAPPDCWPASAATSSPCSPRTSTRPGGGARRGDPGGPCARPRPARRARSRRRASASAVYPMTARMPRP